MALNQLFVSVDIFILRQNNRYFYLKLILVSNCINDRLYHLYQYRSSLNGLKTKIISNHWRRGGRAILRSDLFAGRAS